jgi:hypothetical protein
VIQEKCIKFSVWVRSIKQYYMESLSRWLVVVSVQNASESAVLRDGTARHYALVAVYGALLEDDPNVLLSDDEHTSNWSVTVTMEMFDFGPLRMLGIVLSTHRMQRESQNQQDDTWSHTSNVLLPLLRDAFEKRVSSCATWERIFMAMNLIGLKPSR